MAILSEQAKGLADNLKEFDQKDFDDFYSKLNEVTIVGVNTIFQYLEMKDKGMWKDGKFVVPKGGKDGR